MPCSFNISISGGLKNNITQILNRATKQLSELISQPSSNLNQSKKSIPGLFEQKMHQAHRQYSPEQKLKAIPNIDKNYPIIIKKLEKMVELSTKESERATQNMSSVNRLAMMYLDKLEISLNSQILKREEKVGEEQLMSSSGGLRKYSGSDVKDDSGSPGREKHIRANEKEGKWDLDKLREEIEEQGRSIEYSMKIEQGKYNLMRDMSACMHDMLGASITSGGGGGQTEVERLNAQLLEEVRVISQQLVKVKGEQVILLQETIQQEKPPNRSSSTHSRGRPFSKVLSPSPTKQSNAPRVTKGDEYSNLLKENTKLKLRLRTLEQKVIDIRESPYPPKLSETSPLNKQITDFLEEIAKLKLDQDEMKVYISNTGITIKKFLGAMQRLQRAVAHKESKNMQKLKTDFENGKKELESAAKECENKSKGRASPEKKMVLQQQKSKSSNIADKELKEAQHVVHNLQGKITNLEYQKIKDEGELKQLRSMKVHYQELTEKQTKEINSLQQENEGSRVGIQKLKDLQFENTKIQKEKEGMEKEGKKRTNELNMLHMKNAKLKKVKDNLQEEIKNQKRNESPNKSLDKIRINKEAEDNIKTLQAELRAQKSDKNKLEALFHQKKEETEGRTNQLQLQFDILEKNKQKLEGDISKLTQERNQIVKEKEVNILTLGKEKNDMGEEIVSLKNYIKELHTKIKESEINKKEYIEEYSKLETNNKNLSKELENMRVKDKGAELKANVNANTQEKLVILSEQHKQGLKELGNKEITISKQKEEANALTNEVNTQQIKIGELLVNEQKLILNAKENEGKLDEQKKINLKCTKDLENKEKIAKKHRMDMDKELSEKTTNIEQYKVQISQLSIENNNLGSQINSLKDDLLGSKLAKDKADKEAVTQIVELQKAYETLKLNNENFAKEHFGLRQSLTQKDTTVIDLETQNAQLQKDLEIILFKNQELATSKQEMEERITTQPNIAELQASKSDLMNRIEISDNNVLKLRGDVDKLHEELRNEQNKSLEAKKQHEHESGQIKFGNQIKLGEVEGKNTQLMSKNKSQEDKIRALNNEQKESKKLIEELKAESAEKDKIYQETVDKFNFHRAQTDENTKKAIEESEELIRRLKIENGAKTEILKNVEQDKENYAKEIDEMEGLLKEAGERIQELEGLAQSLTGERNSYEKRYTDLYKEHSIRMNENNKEIKNLNEVYSRLNEQHTKLEQNLNEYDKIMSNLEETNIGLHKNYEEEKEISAKLSTENQALTDDVATLCQEKLARDQTHQEIYDTLKEKDETIQDLNTHLDTHKNKLKTQNHHIEHLTTKVENLDVEKEKIGNKNKELENHLLSHQTNLRDKSAEIENLTLNITKLTEHKEIHENENKSLKEHIQQRSETETKNESKNEELLLNLRQVQDYSEMLSRENQELNNLTEEYKRKLDTRAVEITAISCKLESLNLEKEKFKEEHENVVRRKDEELTEKSLGIEELSGKIVKLREELEGEITREEELKNKGNQNEDLLKLQLQAIQSELKVANQTKGGIEMELTAKTKEFDDLEAEVDQFASENEELNKEIDTLIEKLKESENDKQIIDHLKIDIQTQTEKLKKLTMSNDNLRGTLMDIEMELAQLQTDNSNYSKKIDSLSCKNEELGKENENMEKELGELRTDNLSHKKAKDDKSNEIAKLLEEEEIRQRQIMIKVNELEVEKKEQNKKLKQKELEHIALTGKVSKLEEEKSRIVTELGRAKESQDTSQKQMKIEFEEHFTTYESKMRDLEVENTQNKCAERELHSTHKTEVEKHQQLHIENKQHLDTKDKLIEELKNDIKKKEEKIQELEENCDYQGIQFSIIEEDKNSQSKEINKLKLNIEELNKGITRQKTEMEKKNKELEKVSQAKADSGVEKKVLGEELASISRKLVNKEEENNELNGEIDKYQTEIFTLKNTIEEINLELDKSRNEFQILAEERTHIGIKNKNLEIKVNDDLSILEEKDGKIRHLEEQITKISNTGSGEKEEHIGIINNYEKSISEKDTEIHSLNHSIEKLNKEIEEKEII